jgi:hypothetical protein
MLTLYGCKSSRIISISLILIVTSAVSICFDALFPLFAFTSTDYGGLGMNVRISIDACANHQHSIIGVILSISALTSIVMTTLLLPFCHRRVEERSLLITCEFSHEQD